MRDQQARDKYPASEADAVAFAKTVKARARARAKIAVARMRAVCHDPESRTTSCGSMRVRQLLKATGAKRRAMPAKVRGK